MDEIDDYYSPTYETNPLIVNSGINGDYHRGGNHVLIQHHGSYSNFSDITDINNNSQVINSGYSLSQSKFKVYKTRWWILIVFMMCSLNQCNFWITFGTVAPLASKFYDTSMGNINWLSATGPLMFIPFSVCFSWSINRYGIRKNLLISSGLMALGGIIRAIPNGGDKTFFLIVIGQCFNSLAGPIVMILPTKISTTWFPPSERTLSTAIGTLANFSGSAIGFILALVCTSDVHFKYLLYIEAVFGFSLFLLVCIHFPEKPPSPPSATSYFSNIKSNQKQLLSGSSVIHSEQKTLWESWKELFLNSGTFMSNYSAALLAISCALVSGFYAGWSAVLVEIVGNIYTQEEAQYMGFWGIVAGLVGGIILGMIHDRYHNFKRMLLILFGINTIVYLLFTLLCQGILPNWYWLCQIFNIVGGVVINGYYPIIYEAAVEVSYPIPESIGTALISILLNIITFIAIMITTILPVAYLNWILVSVSGASFIFICFIKEDYKRSKNDNIGNFDSSNSHYTTSIVIPNA